MDVAPGTAVRSGEPTTDTNPTSSPLARETAARRMQNNNLSFIETQFPVSRLSKESYKERKANYSQTLTGLGKWWGRKPLIIARAAILGLLIPASNNPQKDREVFLALLTMDEQGLRRRKKRDIPLKEVYERLSPHERTDWFALNGNANRRRLKKGVKTEDKKRLQQIVFKRLSYDDKLRWCDRPEHLDGPSSEAWKTINKHLGTSATSLGELVEELGKRQFGRVPRVGDAFCGGGSIAFEAARLGCEAYGSDLNPVAAILTWGGLNLIGGGEEVAQEIRQAQTEVFSAADRQITDWRIEHNEVGWRTDAFLYCAETKCPECGWEVPLAPSWVIGEKSGAIARLLADPHKRRFDIEIVAGLGPEELTAARKAGTSKNSRLECPNPDCGCSTPITAIRGDQRGHDRKDHGLRQWENGDLVPRREDVFQERLYCIRWKLPPLVDLLWAEQNKRHTQSLSEDDDPIRSNEGMAPVPDWVELDEAIGALIALLDADEQRELSELRARDWTEENRTLVRTQHELDAKKSRTGSKGEVAEAREQFKTLREIVIQRDMRVAELAKALPSSLYRAVDEDDLARDHCVLTLLQERFQGWQTKGHIPNRTIVPGYNTDQVIRERGWTHWHHLFTPRQLLTHGALAEVSAKSGLSENAEVACLLGLGRAADWDSRLSRWSRGVGQELVHQVFYNQALNTLDDFGVKGFRAIFSSWLIRIPPCKIESDSHVMTSDARELRNVAEFWISDPPYADAINYHELSEFFLAWYEKRLLKFFPEWYTDSKRVLAVRGSDSRFRSSMVDCYRNLVANMPDNGSQVVMFTHQDASVWADLTLILWAAGLRVTAAWTIATETESSFKEGNYVQGTVLMVLRKQTSEESVFLDEVVPDVEIEVKTQLDSMLELDDRDDPNFSDADYQLAAYAAALRVLTRYGSIEDIDVSYQLSRERGDSESNPIEAIIKDAVRTASNYLVPEGLPDHLWRRLGPEEKLYLKGLEVESHGDYRSGVYQEFARGFGVGDYRFMLRGGRANETRLKTASEFQRRELGDTPFGQSLVRHALYATWRAAESGEIAGGLTWLRTELDDYWPQRESLISVLRYLSAVGIDHWDEDADAARLVAGAVENDHV